MVLCVGMLNAQDLSVPVMVKNLTDLSFQKYPKVLEMQDLVHLSEIKIELSKAGYFPIANGELSYRRMYPNDPISIPMGTKTAEIKIMPTDNYNAGISLVQPLLDLKTSVNINKSKSELTASQDNLDNFKLQLAYQVAQLYYGIVFLNKSLNVQQQQLDLIRSNMKLIDTKIKNGDALAYDLVSMQVRYTNSENFYTDTKSQLNKQYNILNMLSGNTGTSSISDSIISDNCFNMATDSVFAIAAANNMDIKAANNKITLAKWDVESSKRTQLPTLNLLAGTGFKNGFLPDITEFRFNYYVGAALTIPIFSASRPYYQKKIAQINLNASNTALETQRLSLNKDILNAMEDLKKNKSKLSSSDTLIIQAKMALKLADDRYKNGVITSLELLTVQTNYQDALLSRLQYEYNLLLTKMELNRLVGKRWW